MSLDRSLRTSGSLAKTRSVLTRAERVAKIQQDKTADKGKLRALGLAKTRVGK